MTNNRSHLFNLTKRESEILNLMTQALSNREISEKLEISIETVRSHTKNIYIKLNVSDRQKASLKAIELELVNVKSNRNKVPNNLPLNATQFIGRTTELTELKAIIENGRRLVTILGGGGMGKTRLAIEYAYQNMSDYGDGVFFVPLDAIRSVEGIAWQIMEQLVLNITNQAHHTQHLFNYLSDKHLLLVIDNWEHLLDGVNILSDIFQNAPNVHIIATSREALSLQEEVVYRLDGLQIPPEDDLDNALNYDAVKLIQQQIRHLYPTWELTPDTRSHVYTLCQLTYGMPLAIMLACGWIDTYSFDQIVKKIQENIDFLATNLRNIEERHRSIHAVFEWTWELLTEDEQSLFMRLSIFRNGCTLDAIQNIADASPSTLQSLVRKSLIWRNEDGRYHLHELLRQYGEKQIQSVPTIERSTSYAHALYYADVANQIMTGQLSTSDSQAELENLYEAWYWSVDNENTNLLWQYVTAFGIIAYQLGCNAEIKILCDYALVHIANFQQRFPNLYKACEIIRHYVYVNFMNSETNIANTHQIQLLLQGIDWKTQRFEMLQVYYYYAYSLRMISLEQSLIELDKLILLLTSLDISQNDLVYQTVLGYTWVQQTYIYVLDYTKPLDPETSKEPALKALNIAQKTNNENLRALAITTLGMQQFRLRNHEQASFYFQIADESYQLLNAPFDYEITLNFAGSNALEFDDYDNARNYLFKALKLHIDLGIGTSIYFLVVSVARWRYKIGDYVKATELIAYCRHYEISIYLEWFISFLWGDFKPPISSTEFQLAVKRGQLLERSMVISEMYALLEE